MVSGMLVNMHITDTFETALGLKRFLKRLLKCMRIADTFEVGQIIFELW
jgi:hypothetical protein